MNPLIFNTLSAKLLNECYSFLSTPDLAKTKAVSKAFQHTISEFTETYPVRQLAVIHSRPVNRNDFLTVFEEQKIAHSEECRVAILTCDGKDKYKGDDTALMRAFRQYGVHAEHVVWNGPSNNWNRFQAALVRSTWDYCQNGNLDKFLVTLRQVHQAGVVLLNPLQTIEWNSNKRYLRDLSKKGIQCVDTVWLSSTNFKYIAALMKYKGWQECVIKPAVGAGGFNTFRFQEGDLKEVIAKCEATGISEWMLQPFESQIIKEGEWSFVFRNKKIVKCVRKKPGKGNFLVQDFRGGTVHHDKPPHWMVKKVKEIYKRIGHDTLIGRIDVIRSEEGEKLKVMEVEFIEPYLFFDHSYKQAQAVAHAVVKRLYDMQRIHTISMHDYHFRFLQRELGQFGENLGVLYDQYAGPPSKRAFPLGSFLHAVATPQLEAQRPVRTKHFPRMIEYHSTVVPYDNAFELNQVILVIAETICNLFARYLLPQESRWEMEQSESLTKDDYPLPTAVDDFKGRLRGFIQRELNRGDEDYDHVYLSTDYGPEKDLREVMQGCGIQEKYKTWELYPIKTSVNILRIKRKNIIEIMMVPSFLKTKGVYQTMIPAYQRLTDLVTTGQLELLHVVAPPRANGTALHQALTQAPEVQGQLNEPFFYEDLKGRKWDFVRSRGEKFRTLDQACMHVLSRYDQLKDKSQGKKVTLVVHDLSTDLTSEEFRKFTEVSSHTIVTVRETTKQALSMLMRHTNDYLSDLGGDKLKTKDVVAMMKDGKALQAFAQANPDKVSLSAIYKLAGKKEGADKLSEADFALARRKTLDRVEEEFTIAWENIHHFYQKLRKSEGTPFTIFDAEMLFVDSEAHLGELARRCKVTYTKAMIDNWTRGTGDDFHCVITANWPKDLAMNNAWNGPARKSKRLELKAGSVEKAVEMASFPVELHASIQRCDRLYKEIFADRMT